MTGWGCLGTQGWREPQGMLRAGRGPQGQVRDPWGWQGIPVAVKEPQRQAVDARAVKNVKGRQGTPGAGKRRWEQAEDLEDRQGTGRAALTSALGDLQQASAGDGDAALLLGGGSGGLLCWPMGGGPRRAFRDQSLLAELCGSGMCHIGDDSSIPAFTGSPGEGDRDSGLPRWERQSRPGPCAGSRSPAPPAPRSPFVSERQKRGLCRSPDKGGLSSCGGGMVMDTEGGQETP